MIKKSRRKTRNIGDEKKRRQNRLGRSLRRNSVINGYLIVAKRESGRKQQYYGKLMCHFLSTFPRNIPKVCSVSLTVMDFAVNDQHVIIKTLSLHCEKAVDIHNQ